MSSASLMSPGSRLARFVVLANDPAVPAVAADWWEISEPHYLSVVTPLAEFTAGDRAAGDLARLAEEPTDPGRERALAAALDRLLDRDPAGLRRFAALMAAAEEHILIDHHRGTLSGGEPADPVGPDELLTWQRPRPARSAGPAALVVIPFRDRTGGARVRNLLACLASLRDQSSGAEDVTVTVVETDDEPRWRDTIEPWVDDYVFAPHTGHFNKSWAVNVGVRRSRSAPGALCVLDADILADDRFVSRNLARFERPELAAFLPYRGMFCLDDPSSDAAIRARVQRGEPDVPVDAVRALVLREPPGACLWVRSETFHRVGGFDERFQGWGGEDDDVVARLAAAGRLERFDDPLLHLSHPRPQMVLDGRPFNAHIEPMSWTASHGYGDLRGPAAAG
ncbi:galactosyltransferase-related protein [Streptosporangium sandarakinum]